jgi:hypothetical protein
MRSLTKLIAISLICLAPSACAKEQTATQTPIERGKYLVTFGGCHDCFTAKMPGPDGASVPDATKLLAGHPATSWLPEDIERKGVVAATNSSLTAWAGPWGVSFAINLTPDKTTGIGEWSEENFIQMARTGKHQGQPNGRDILPPMPWFNMKDLTDADLKAMWAYLKGLPPVKNQVPLPILPSAAAAAAAPK